ncbi:asparaginase domain-containing protein [Rothia sp. ZJ932]|uniref:asparaginase domain-containing protein n=1 Tax=Rothia sp. ZJ932 TaxID=2810516 RepID=UPI00196824AF|nr:asparaginase domain-containing protein [Rothia sp. ZJ932]QRZ61825.1 asparaginase [Rothia sp. ZJ932]
MTIKSVEKITILTTGGTIDKVYSVAGELEIGDPSVPQLLTAVLTDVEFELIPVLAVDSLDMTDTDRAQLVDALEGVATDHVIITHGTDTMPETARYLLEHARLEGKIVVLTGAMQPASMRVSDAGFNLGAAVAALNLLDAGVYVSMSGKIFKGATVVKDRSRGIFGVRP